MSNVVNSIFRQREIEKIYGINCRNILSYDLEYVKKMEVSGIDKRVLSDKVIGTYDVEIPMLEVGEEFFLQDIGETVKIKKRMRSSDGSITYYVEDKVLETENSRKSYEFSTNKITQFEEFMKYKEEYRYKHRFFNFRVD